ncbi:MAG: hypothetical protein B6U85_02795 [Desulfurococcales archaeon ex4484_42]|nr:MAG: hypothetical protein B6U85_02795 [Desulfurococcales archaeon ex4484_42]
MIYVYMVPYMGSRDIYLRIDEELLKKFTKIAEMLGMSRSEAIRKAMEMFIISKSGKSITSRMRELVKSKLTLRELEEIYLVSK